MIRLLYAHAIMTVLVGVVFVYSYLSTGSQDSFLRFSAQLIRRDGIILTYALGYLIFLVIFVILPFFWDGQKIGSQESDKG
jgi:hypothetical protein